MRSLVECVNDQKLVFGRSLPVVHMLERKGAGAHDFAAPAAKIGIGRIHIELWSWRGSKLDETTSSYNDEPL